jgi:hypothetical protein
MIKSKLRLVGYIVWIGGMTKHFNGILKGRDNLGDLDIDRRIILLIKWVLKKGIALSTL